MSPKIPDNVLAVGAAGVLAVYGIGYAMTNASWRLSNEIKLARRTEHAGDYRDGRYRAVGTSPFGDVWVDVTVRRRRIEAVEIPRVTTFYPESDIAALPAEAVARQSAGIDIVSGATGSTAAFFDAVTRALDQATRPPAKDGR
jgi:uncharacterized protein with FMN-binding domain